MTSSVMTRMPRACAACDEALQVRQRAVVGMHAAIVGDVVAVVAPRRGIERQQPDRVDAELGDVVELGDQPGEIADAVVVGVEERLDVQLVDDRVLVPERIVGGGRRHASVVAVMHVHRAPRAGATRQIANGRSAGSSRMRCRLAGPGEAVAAHQVVDVDACRRRAGPNSHSGNFDIGLLRVVRIEADRDQRRMSCRSPASPCRRTDHLVVERGVETSRRDASAAPDCARRMRLSAVISATMLPGRVPVRTPDLVFLASRDIPRAPAAASPRTARSRYRCPTGPTASPPARRGSGSPAAPEVCRKTG